MIKSCGLYVVSDKFFDKYDKSHKLMLNKGEKRPYYCGIKASNGIVWLVPLSSQVDKYRASIKADEKKHGKGNCIFHYITKVKGKENAFLIGNAFPCTEKYIVKPFTVSGVPFVIQDSTDIKAIRKKLSRYIALVRNGKLHPNADILGIEKQLLSEGEPLPTQNECYAFRVNTTDEKPLRTEPSLTREELEEIKRKVAQLLD